MRNKSYFLLFGIWLLAAQSLPAQSIQPSVGTIIHNDAPRPCLVVNVDPEPKTLKKAWKDFLQDHYDFKLKGIGFLSNKDLLSAEQVVVEQISSKEMDFYTHIVEDDNGSEMKVFAAFGYDLYVDSTNMPAEYNAMKAILERFLKDYLPKYHRELVEETEKTVKELSEEQADLKKDIKKDEEEIEALTEELETLSENLQENKEKLKTAEQKLENRKAKLDRVVKQYNNQ